MALSAAQPVLYNFASTVMLDPDVELMLRLKAGDDACFDQLVARYRTPVLSFLYRMVHNGDLAEELAQETFLRVYRARRQYRPEAKFSTWLFRIASNLALNALRDGAWDRQHISLEEAAESAGTSLAIPDPALGIEEELMRRERARIVAEAIDALPPKQRLAVLLHKYQDLDYAEIAGILGCSESALKSLLFRAYEKLRVRLAPLVSTGSLAKEKSDGLPGNR